MRAGTPRGVGHFRNDAARQRLLLAYDALLAEWTEAPRPRDVDTAFGSTRVNSIERPTGSPIVLLHPLAVTSASWYASGPALAAAGHPVHAVDTITDAGRSVQDARVRHGDDLAVWLDQVLDGLALRRAHVVGVSYGAFIAMNHLRRRPERVISVTAVDPPAVIARAPASLVVAMMRGALAARFRRDDDALYPLLRRLHNGRLPDEPLLELSVASIRGFVARQPFPRRWSDDTFRTVGRPLLYLVGGVTPVVPDATAAADRVRRLAPGGRAEVVPGAGHALPLEHPDAVNQRILEFVTATDR